MPGDLGSQSASQLQAVSSWHSPPFKGAERASWARQGGQGLPGVGAAGPSPTHPGAARGCAAGGRAGPGP